MNNESDDNKRKRRGRGVGGVGGGAVLIGDSSEKQTETNLPSLQVPISGTHGTITPGHIVAGNISSCPRFDRLRLAAKEDRHEIHLKRIQEEKRAEESRQRRAAASDTITMNDFYATLFVPAVSSENVVVSNGGDPTATTVPTTAPTPNLQFRDRDVVLKDVEDSFVACYYHMYPEALTRHKEAEEEAERRRRSTIAASQLVSLAGETGRSRTASPLGKKSKGKKKKKEEPLPREGAPAANLGVLLSALIAAGDSKGLITQDALADVLAKAPFEVRDSQALEAFFFAVRSSSTAKGTTESESERRLNNSSSTTTSNTRGLKRNPSMRVSNAQVHSSTAALSPSSPIASVANLQASLRRGPPTTGGSFYIRRTGFTPRTSRVFTSSVIMTAAASSAGGGGGGAGGAAAAGGGGGGGSSAAEVFPAPVVRVREVLAAVDAIMNGPELRDVVRSICFNVLETDGYIHKATLQSMRLTRREACEDKDALVTPSIVKALGDAIEVMLQEEEQEYIRTQLKDKRRKNKGKAPTLLPHQKSVIPLHMMRRSHMNRKEFFRFFDELPLFAASFMHVWFPAFFSTTWPPVKQVTVYDTNTDDAIEEEYDENEISNNTNNNISNTTSTSNAFLHPSFGETRSQREVFEWDKVATGSLAILLRSSVQRRNLARKIVTERLDHMKLSAPEDSDATV
ncbi:uncharacterized protein TM35_000251430 [Trypanosoma theileri]|uniref:Uncharacterized protein n=1 Tax=Trypanosoma theileri TaxID=67003 RepID=A0A1X0NQ83_9TRYP|nr:uncharacterized protein TM35_000251430 [Trypanosoma theileri]ORC86847.1 hypothetical protein TM35_000251430 [Trypanosoma theileri]